MRHVVVGPVSDEMRTGSTLQFPESKFARKQMDKNRFNDYNLASIHARMSLSQEAWDFCRYAFPKNWNSVDCVMPVGQESPMQAIQTIKVAHGRER